jgi:hypothetical protein
LNGQRNCVSGAQLAPVILPLLFLKLGKSWENLLKNYQLALKTHCVKKELDFWYITKK